MESGKMKSYNEIYFDLTEKAEIMVKNCGKAIEFLSSKIDKEDEDLKKEIAISYFMCVLEHTQAERLIKYSKKERKISINEEGIAMMAIERYINQFTI